MAEAIFLIFSTLVSMYTSKTSADKQTKNLERQAEVKADQATANATDRLTEQQRKARRERALMQVTNSESGISGQSNDLLLMNQMFMNDEFATSVDNNNTNALASIQAESDTAFGGIQQPDYLGAALQIGSAGYNGVQDSKAAKAPTTTGV